MSDATTAPPMYRATRTQLVLAFGCIYLVWGSTYFAIRIGLETIPPFVLAAARFLVAGSSLYAWTRLRGAPKPTALEWRNSAIVGAMLLFVANGCVTWAEQRVSSGMASLLVATVPLWLVVCERWRGVKPTTAQVLGVVVGLVGVALLVLPANGDWSRAAVDPIGAIALTLSSLSWTVGSLFSRTAVFAKPAGLAIAMQMLVGGALLTALALVTGEVQQLVAAPHVSLPSVGALAYLIVFGSLVGFSTYMWLIKSASPTAVGTYAYVNPVVAVLLGVLFLDETLPPRAVAAMLVIVGGVALVSLGPKLREVRWRR